jgi:phosphatidate cytidylyltransferase
LAVWAQFTLPALTSTQRAAIEPALFFLIVAAILIRQFPQKENPRPLETMAGTLMGVLYVPLMLGFYPRLLLTWGADGGRWLIFYGVLVVKFSDIGAYFVGCTLGRHKLCPRISPKKTWEGLIGGIAASLAVSLLWWHFAHGRAGALALTLPHAVILGLLLPVMGLFGDLAESVLKRAANVKDSASYIQGMGGVLDVLDSLLLTAPALYIYALLLLKPIT